MNKKQKVKNHIINLIVGGALSHGDLTPSETRLMNIYKCSRNPVREALKELVYSGWVNVKKGKGYFVSGIGDYSVHFAKGAFKINNTKIRELNQNENNLLREKVESISKPRHFVKEYYKDKKLIMKTINKVSNNVLFYLTNKEIESGFIQNCISHGIKLTHQNRSLIFTNDTGSKWGWGNNMPVINAVTYCDHEPIEVSLIFIQKEYFEFNKKILF